MKAVLKIDIADWTHGGLPALKKGTAIKVDRITSPSSYSDYIGTIIVRGIHYSFELHKKEFDSVN